MCRLSKAITIFFLFVASGFLTGCSQKDFYPSPDIIVSTENPNIIPASADELPNTTFTFKAINGVTCTLISYSVLYRSYLHEEISQLNMSDLPISLRIPGADWSENRDTEGEEVTTEIKIYTSRVKDLLAITQSDISPITAEVTFNYKDVNKNTGSVSCSCLLYKYEETTSENSNSGENNENSENTENSNTNNET